MVTNCYEKNVSVRSRTLRSSGYIYGQLLLWNRNYLLLFRFRLRKSFVCGSLFEKFLFRFRIQIRHRIQTIFSALQFFHCMLDPDPNPVPEPDPDLECIPVPVPLRQKVAVTVPVQQHCCQNKFSFGDLYYVILQLMSVIKLTLCTGVIWTGFL
jgi:hypothetical protein